MQGFDGLTLADAVTLRSILTLENDMIYTTIDNASQFRDEFHRCGRGTQFSYEALGLLFDWFDELGEDIELDVIAICCDYSEDTPESIAQNYDIDIDEDDDDIAQQVVDYLEKHSAVIGVTGEGTIVYANF
jgi:hypothetical protein